MDRLRALAALPFSRKVVVGVLTAVSATLIMVLNKHLGLGLSEEEVKVAAGAAALLGAAVILGIAHEDAASKGAGETPTPPVAGKPPFAPLALLGALLLLPACRGLDAAYVRADVDVWNSIAAEHDAAVTRACAGKAAADPIVTPTGYRTTVGEFLKSRAAWHWTWHRRLKRAHVDLGWDSTKLRAPTLREDGAPPLLEPPAAPRSPPIPDAPTATAVPALDGEGR